MLSIQGRDADAVIACSFFAKECALPPRLRPGPGLQITFRGSRSAAAERQLGAGVSRRSDKLTPRSAQMDRRASPAKAWPISANVSGVHDVPEPTHGRRRHVHRLSQAIPFTACGGKRRKAPRRVDPSVSCWRAHHQHLKRNATATARSAPDQVNHRTQQERPAPAVGSDLNRRQRVRSAPRRVLSVRSTRTAAIGAQYPVSVPTAMSGRPLLAHTRLPGVAVSVAPILLPLGARACS